MLQWDRTCGSTIAMFKTPRERPVRLKHPENVRRMPDMRI